MGHVDHAWRHLPKEQGGTDPIPGLTIGEEAVGSFQEQILAQATLWAYWPMNDLAGSTTIVDASGNGRILTVRGTPTFEQPGPFPATSDTSILLEGTDGSAAVDDGFYRTFVAPNNADTFAGSYSVEILVYPTVVNANSPGIWEYGNASDQHMLWLNTGIQPVYTATGGILGINIPFNQWTHLVTTYDGTTKRLYQNGVLVASGASSPLDLGNIEFHIGFRRALPGTIHRFFKGRVAQAAIYTTALTATEVANHYNAGVRNDPRYSSVRSITAARTLDASDDVVLANGTFTVTLPTAAGIAGRSYTIKNTGVGTITVGRTGGETIDGAAANFSIATTQESVEFISNGAGWEIVDSYLEPAAGGAGAPSTADYLVGTANGGLSAEIVVGTTPGGELGGTWASPTIDASHSGSTHAAVQAAAEATAAAALTAHTGDAVDAHDASAISFVPHGSIAATDVQAAIQEVRDEAGGGSGAPTTVDYLVGTADAGLSNEIVVGATPGGELGGTWASPTVDASHSGSTHAAVQAAAEATAAAALTTHEGDTTSVHGITDTADVVLRTIVDAKGDLIAGTAADTVARRAVGANGTLLVAASGEATGLEWRTLADGDIPAAIARDSEVTTAVSNHEADTTSVHGITNTANLYVAGGTDVALADGGTGASLTDPNADRIMFWDDSAAAVAFLTPSTGLTITGTDLTAAVPIMCRATGDHAISSATETDVAGMSLALAANTKYAVEFFLRCSANAATVGIHYYLTFGGTVTRFDGNLDYYITVSAKGSVDVVNDTTSPFTFEPAVSHGNVVLMNCIYGLLEVGASGGTLQLQHGSETATLTTVFRGSFGRATPVA